ncbi:hypothetical protein GLYMA_04G186351v4 [Glycine max]|nr:hypothetical protein GLYMA_04G186351v4 [Glycine max]KAH1112011.1 hypothetical protein GYH30_010381 [Glycine max]
MFFFLLSVTFSPFVPFHLCTINQVAKTGKGKKDPVIKQE